MDYLSLKPEYLNKRRHSDTMLSVSNSNQFLKPSVTPTLSQHLINYSNKSLNKNLSNDNLMFYVETSPTSPTTPASTKSSLQSFQKLNQKLAFKETTDEFESEQVTDMKTSKSSYFNRKSLTNCLQNKFCFNNLNNLVKAKSNNKRHSISVLKNIKASPYGSQNRLDHFYNHLSSQAFTLANMPLVAFSDDKYSILTKMEHMSNYSIRQNSASPLPSPQPSAVSSPLPSPVPSPLPSPLPSPIANAARHFPIAESQEVKRTKAKRSRSTQSNKKYKRASSTKTNKLIKDLSTTEPSSVSLYSNQTNQKSSTKVYNLGMQTRFNLSNSRCNLKWVHNFI